MTITEFLEARIAEDVARAVEARDWVASGPTPHFPWYGSPGDRAGKVLGGAHPLISAMSPARVLAECAAKRKIIDLHQRVDYVQRMVYGDIYPCSECGSIDDSPVEWPCPTLKTVASVYSDHPDYQQEWPRG